MIYLKRPKNFNPEFEVSSCLVENSGKILLLHRQNHKPQGNTWGVPAGKVDIEEDPLKTIIRETKEETGIDLKNKKISFLRKIYVRFPDYDFTYHMFHISLDKEHEIKINEKEHKNFMWISPEDALKIELIQDLDKCIKLSYKLD